MEISAEARALDGYEEEREKKRGEVADCQAECRLKSCFSCEKLFDCQIRSAYVNAVYSSMSKGQGGDFDF